MLGRSLFCKFLLVGFCWRRRRRRGGSQCLGMAENCRFFGAACKATCVSVSAPFMCACLFMCSCVCQCLCCLHLSIISLSPLLVTKSVESPARYRPAFGAARSKKICVWRSPGSLVLEQSQYPQNPASSSSHKDLSNLTTVSWAALSATLLRDPVPAPGNWSPNSPPPPLLYKPGLRQFSSAPRLSPCDLLLCKHRGN